MLDLGPALGAELGVRRQGCLACPAPATDDQRLAATWAEARVVADFGVAGGAGNPIGNVGLLRAPPLSVAVPERLEDHSRKHHPEAGADARAGSEPRHVADRAIAAALERPGAFILRNLSRSPSAAI